MLTFEPLLGHQYWSWGNGYINLEPTILECLNNNFTNWINVVL